MRTLIVIAVMAGTLLPLRAGAHGHHTVTFTENRGQWPAQVLYRALVPDGVVFVEADALTFVQYADLPLQAHGGGHVPAGPPRAHAYRVHFVGGRATAHQGERTAAHYENHFIGNDPDHWGTGCAVHGAVRLKDVWPGIDMRLDGAHGLKYDLIVAPGADPAAIALRYAGHLRVETAAEELHVHLTTGMVFEEAPVVFHAEGRDTVPARYRLEGDVLTFMLGPGHDPARTLVIDPVLTFSSFSGSTANNFGFTATYDAEGHLYGGGIVFGPGYPVTLGAYDPTFNSGIVDVGVSKWSPDGSTLVWSTYFGGQGADAPHSMVVNADNELFVFGSTGSSDLPITPGCHDATFNGGPPVGFAGGYGFTFANGSDGFIARFSADATVLMGSTYIGGSGTDAVNNSPLSHNYGDPFRGEVALDPAGDPVVATCTNSPDMPVTPGAPQPMHGGAMDGYVFRMDAALTTLMWATFRGGSDDDTANGVQFNSSGQVYVAGGTRSADMPMAGDPWQPAHAGHTDGYVARYAPGGALLAATHLGTPQYDQAFFVQVDVQDDVYVVGQTYGDYPVTPGVYANPGSGVFIHKLAPDLGASVWSTRIGNGDWDQDLSPSAFLVSDCGQIYFSGWAGTTNNMGAPQSSTTNGLPITTGAFQSSTDGSDFYLMVLEPDAAALNYGSYFGGTSAEHVDGGTSRFDKNGKVYQAVCAGCGGGSFPTTPGVHGPVNNSSCNLGVFKFDLFMPQIAIAIEGDDQICYPGEVSFTNNSTGGNTWAWDFGDGGTSTEFEPAHTYTAPGTYTVTLVMTDQYGCTQAAEDSIVVESLGPPVAVIDPVPPTCPGVGVQLTASDGTAWQWSPSAGLSDPAAQAPIATPDTTTTYQLVLTTPCGTDTAWVEVTVHENPVQTLPDVELCMGDSVQLQASQPGTYLWSPAEGLSDTLAAGPMAAPADTTTYAVLITVAPGCVLIDSVTVNVAPGPPQPALQDTAVCIGGSVQLHAPVGTGHQWQPAPGLTDLLSGAPFVSPTEGTTYVVTVTNVCGQMQDSAHVAVIVPQAMAWPDTLACPGQPVQLHAGGAISYAWAPVAGLDDPQSADPIATVWTPTTFTVTGTDEWGCTDTASVHISLRPAPFLDVVDELVVDFGDPAPLTAYGDGSFLWTPPTGLACDTCAATTALAMEGTTIYTVTITDAYGCTSSAPVRIIVTGSLYVPNTFTPNADGTNDLFGALGREMDWFRMRIHDRWGVEVFRTESLDGRWDGTHNGQELPIGVYVWTIEAQELAGRRHERVGHVTLLR
ncbi:MAG: gliding motility-associated C-terminal domain-containing protein [Flavobacteriales bacterium]|jgi:gliding motility-associated-like protein|nr:gliding motility-associated C-terminal domain-containing protein [Flavobacteriales bacterium]